MVGHPFRSSKKDGGSIDGGGAIENVGFGESCLWVEHIPGRPPVGNGDRPLSSERLAARTSGGRVLIRYR